MAVLRIGRDFSGGDAVALRSRSRGTVLLRRLAEGSEAWPRATALYLACDAGPWSPLARAAAAGPNRLQALSRALPPKDYFVSTPSMKAAQLGIDLGLQGPWTAFTSPEHGLQQALHFARNDLEDGAVPAAVVAGLREDEYALLCFARTAAELPSLELIERNLADVR